MSLDIETSFDGPSAWSRGGWASDSPAVAIEPEVVLPVQFAELRRNGEARPPEHRLMLAVLEDAVHTYQLGCRADGAARRPFQETERWFTSDDTAWPFSFVTICQVWGLDPDYVRAGLARWRTGRDSRATPIRLRRVSGSRHQVTTRRMRRRA